MDDKRIEIHLICDGKTVVGVRMVDGEVTNSHAHKVSSLFELNENMEFCAALGFLEGVNTAEDLPDERKVGETE